jgi:phosphate transport system substrate-binding protein
MREMTEAAASRFRRLHPGVRVTVGASGDSTAVDAFCAGEIDIATVARKLDADEQRDCDSAETRYASIELARIGIALVVSRSNPYATCLTLDQVRAIWPTHDAAQSWADASVAPVAAEIRPIGWKPDSPPYTLLAQALYGGTDPKTRDDAEVASDAGDLMAEVAASPNAIGYLPFAEYRRGRGVRLLAVDGGEGCLMPTVRTITDRSYSTLSRPLYLDVSRESLGEPAVRAFVHDYLRWMPGLGQTAEAVPTVNSHRVYRRFTRP